MRSAIVLAAALGIGLFQAARAETADCLEADPAKFEQVYACMSSVRDPRSGTNMFVNNIGTSDCLSIRKRYRHALVSSLGEQMRGREREMGKAYQQQFNRIMHDDTLLPSCDILARVSREMTGKAAFWDGCLGFGTVPQAEHLKTCLATFVPGYFGKGRKVENLQGCGDVFSVYEAGLRSADPDKTLPTGYTRPECGVAADYLASLRPKPVATASSDQARPKWEPCMEYDPADVPGHLRRCLGLTDKIPPSAWVTLTDCRSVRTAYEAGLTKAYGRLPETYVVLPCSLAEPLVAEIQAAKAAAAEEAHRAETQRMRQQAMKEANFPTPERGFFSGAIITWTILAGLVLALGAGAGGWLFLKRRRTS